VLADDQIAVRQIGQVTLSAPSALREDVIGPITKTVGRVLSRCGGAADDEFRRDRRRVSSAMPASDLRPFRMAGDIGESRIHGRDERVLVKSFFTGGDYLYRLVKELAGGQ